MATSQPAPRPEGDPEPVRALQWLAAGLVLAEALLLLGASVVLAVAALRRPNDQTAASFTLVVIGLIVGGALAWCARGVLNGIRWSRAPVVTWQLVQVGVALPLVVSTGWWIGAPLLLAGVAVLLLVTGRRVIPREAT